MADQTPATPPPAAGATPAEVIHRTRTVVCAQAGRPMSLRDFAELLGNCNYERVRQFEAGAVEPTRDEVAEWFSHADARIVEMTRQIFIARSWSYLQGSRDAYSLPTFMTSAV